MHQEQQSRDALKWQNDKPSETDLERILLKNSQLKRKIKFQFSRWPEIFQLLSTGLQFLEHSFTQQHNLISLVTPWQKKTDKWTSDTQYFRYL